MTCTSGLPTAFAVTRRPCLYRPDPRGPASSGGKSEGNPGCHLTTEFHAYFLPRGVPEVGVMLRSRPRGSAHQGRRGDVAGLSSAHSLPHRAPTAAALRRPSCAAGGAGVMLDLGPQDTDKLLTADDQQLVQALPADRADPALGDGSGVGRRHRCADDLSAPSSATRHRTPW